MQPIRECPQTAQPVVVHETRNRGEVAGGVAATARYRAEVVSPTLLRQQRAARGSLRVLSGRWYAVECCRSRVRVRRARRQRYRVGSCSLQR